MVSIQSPDDKCHVARTRPLPAASSFRPAEARINCLHLVSAGRYRIARRARWEGFTRFIDDGRIEIDSNIVERAIRPIALNRKNALLAGSDEGGAAWGVVASLIETCKLNGVEPFAYLSDVLTKIADSWPMRRLDELLPWNYVTPRADVA